MQYKFRGKRIDNNEWVIGSYHYCTGNGAMRFIDYKDGNRVVEDKGMQFNCHWILVHQTPNTPGWDVRETFKPYAVTAESVGIYFGWIDSYEKEIFTGDRLEIQWTDEETTCEIISYSQDYGYFMYGNNPICELIESKVKSKVIGNIHDEVKPAVQDSVIINMNNNFDPRDLQPASEEVKEVEAQPAEQASEQATTESAEEGQAEG